MSHCYIQMMDTHYCVLLILFYLCNGVFGADIYLFIYKNKTGNLYEESHTIEYSYLNDEAVTFTCSISGNTIKDGIFPALTWIEDGKEWTPPNDGVSITTTKILKKDDDGTELKCRAKSPVLDEEWTISAYFERQKSPQEILKAQTSIFKLLLIALGGTIGATILLLSTYRLFLCCRKKRAANRLDKEKVVPEDKSKKPDNPQLTEIGFDNIACHLKDNDTYICFDSPESEHFDNDITLKICQNDSQETKQRNLHIDDAEVCLGNKEDSDC